MCIRYMNVDTLFIHVQQRHTHKSRTVKLARILTDYWKKLNAENI